MTTHPIDITTHRGITDRVTPAQPTSEPDGSQELREFLAILYRALRMICAFLERKYGFGRTEVKQET